MVDSKGAKVNTYQVCHNRKHKSYITHAQICGNLVISVEDEGLIAVTLISFEDAEEFETRFISDFAVTNVFYFFYFEEWGDLIAISNSGQAVLYKIEFSEDASNFSLTLEKSID